VDSHVSSRNPTKVGPDYDNLLAKIIVTAGTWGSVVRKVRRLLADVVIAGVKTNLNLLRGIVNNVDFLAGHTDTQWLERNILPLIQAGNAIGASQSSQKSVPPNPSRSPLANLVASSSSVFFRKGDAWSLTLEPLKSQSGHVTPQSTIQSHLLINRVLRNDFPSSLTAEIEYSSSSPNDVPGGSSTSTTAYRIHLKETNASASALTLSKHRRGDPTNKNHIIFPLSGKLIEVLVAPGDEIVSNQVVAFVKQMKMELEIRSHRPGIVKWVFDPAAGTDGQVSNDQGVDVAEGSLLLELEEWEDIKGKL
jgi:acetyl/propionyl-CoA carboxylase alpha subunit